MKKTFFLLMVAVAVLVVSLAINVTKNNSSSGNVTLAELVQTAHADEFWSFNWSGLNFGCEGEGIGFFGTFWWNNVSYDVPFDNTGNQVTCCLAGGSSQCTISMHTETIDFGYDGETHLVETRYGRWAGGSDSYVREQYHPDFNPSEGVIYKTIGNNTHLFYNQWFEE